jgi:hypothetical protein
MAITRLKRKNKKSAAKKRKDTLIPDLLHRHFGDVKPAETL